MWEEAKIQKRKVLETGFTSCGGGKDPDRDRARRRLIISSVFFHDDLPETDLLAVWSASGSDLAFRTQSPLRNWDPMCLDRTHSIPSSSKNPSSQPPSHPTQCLPPTYPSSYPHAWHLAKTVHDRPPQRNTSGTLRSPFDHVTVQR